MKLFASILGGFICLDIWVWLRLDRAVRTFGRPRMWRILLAFLMLTAISFAVLSMFSNRTIGREHHLIPKWIPASIYIWHFLILPFTVIVLVIQKVIGSIIRMARANRVPSNWYGSPASAAQQPSSTPAVAPSAAPAGEAPSPAAQPPVALPSVSRRRFMAAAMAIPPIATFSLAGIATSQIGKFRIQRHDLAIAGWPRTLDNFTIALVADVHTGLFSTPKMLSDIVAATNNLRADLILMAGDLINISHSDLPSAIGMALKLDSPLGMYMVQGNHDVVQGPGPFDAACQAAGLNLLINQAATLRPRGVPIQILGMKWGPEASDQSNDVRNIQALRDPEAFPIMLAHHPHTWDPAAAHGIPLVISGHTHGGQIMLTDSIGGGPLRFRYWSGVYQRPGSTLLVSNGVGNWFPLRVNAPAEINHITLHPARPDLPSIVTGLPRMARTAPARSAAAQRPPR